MITIKTGDLLKAEEKVIAHQVNCHGATGGLAGVIFRKYRVAENDYMQLANSARIMGWSVALPYKLSCGICGGDWDEVLKIIERTMEGVDCVIYKKEEK